MPPTHPRLLYRVYPDGHEELVRGAVFNELDVRALRKRFDCRSATILLSATGKAAWRRRSITPSLLFDELEVKRADTSKDKLPDYPAPPLQSQTSSSPKK